MQIRVCSTHRFCGLSPRAKKLASDAKNKIFLFACVSSTDTNMETQKNRARLLANKFFTHFYIYLIL